MTAPTGSDEDWRQPAGEPPLNLGPRRTPPLTGGTIERPANLYPPGVGDCPECGAVGVPTVAGGRLTAHGPEARKDTAGRYWVTTCTGWGRQAR